MTRNKKLLKALGVISELEIDDNILDRFIRGMDDPERFSYFVALTDIVDGVMSSDIFKATEEQKQEAIAKAKGWEEGS